MDYIYEEGTLGRHQEEAVYDLAFRSENLFRIRQRLTKEKLISQEEEIVLDKVQSAVLSLMLDYASSVDIVDRALEYSEELSKSRE